MNVSTILDQIDMGGIALPEFQRGYVWNREQVRNLMDSLYRRHPVGGLLVWVTQTEQASDHARGDGQLTAGVVKLLLDGQQRITSLYGIIRGEAPKFFDGNAQALTGLYFNLEDEIFEFYSPRKMDGNPIWVNVTALMKQGIGDFMPPFFVPEYSSKLTKYLQRINAVEGIKNIDFHIEEVIGADKTVDVVVDIFNKVNSGGTKLSKGDLALAKICAEYPSARDELKQRLDKWAKAGFHFRMELLLRCINAVVTNEALFSAFKDVKTDRFKKGLSEVEHAIDTLLNLISARLGLDHDRVLGSHYALPLMARYLDQRGGHFPSYQERDQLLYWYIHTFLWGRYAGSTESVLRQDLLAITPPSGNLDNLIALLRQNRGDLRIKPDDFKVWSMGSRFYPLLYMLTRVYGARDWEDDLPISKHLLGSLNSLEVHHIFPKSKLYESGYGRAEVNAIANFTFLTKDTNLKVSNRDPAEYFAHYEAKNPGTIASHWIPMDQHLWKVENYQDFLAARRELLAQAANGFLDSLYSGTVPESEAAPSVLERSSIVISGGSASEEEDQALQACNAWVAQQGLPEGKLMYELAVEATGEAIAVLDLAWTDGLQEGLSQPVALLIDEDLELEQIVNQAGYRFFTDIDSFKQYVQREILVSEEMVAAVEGDE